MKGVKRIIGGILMIVGISLCTLYFFSSPDKKTLARQADYGGVSATSPSAKSKAYLFAGFAIGLIGAGIVRRS